MIARFTVVFCVATMAAALPVVPARAPGPVASLVVASTSDAVAETKATPETEAKPEETKAVGDGAGEAGAEAKPETEVKPEETKAEGDGVGEAKPETDANSEETKAEVAGAGEAGAETGTKTVTDDSKTEAKDEAQIASKAGKPMINAHVAVLATTAAPKQDKGVRPVYSHKSLHTHWADRNGVQGHPLTWMMSVCYGSLSVLAIVFFCVWCDHGPKAKSIDKADMNHVMLHLTHEQGYGGYAAAGPQPYFGHAL